MNFKTVKDNNWVIFECISGSHAYGTNIATSDLDRRGVFVYPVQNRLTLFDLPAEVSEDGEDTKLFELRKFFELAIKATPNMLELLYMPQDCVVSCSPLFQKIIDNRTMFITQKAIDTFGAYSISQIKKSRGANKKVNSKQTAGLKKIRTLLSSKRISKEWIISRCGREVFEAVNKF